LSSDAQIKSHLNRIKTTLISDYAKANELGLINEFKKNYSGLNGNYTNLIYESKNYKGIQDHIQSKSC